MRYTNRQPLPLFTTFVAIRNPFRVQIYTCIRNELFCRWGQVIVELSFARLASASVSPCLCRRLTRAKTTAPINATISSTMLTEQIMTTVGRESMTLDSILSPIPNGCDSFPRLLSPPDCKVKCIGAWCNCQHACQSCHCYRLTYARWAKKDCFCDG